jgi:hypothetical protein
MRVGVRFVACVTLALSVAGCTSNQLGPQRPITIDDDVVLTRPLAVPDLSTFYIVPRSTGIAAESDFDRSNVYC